MSIYFYFYQHYWVHFLLFGIAFMYGFTGTTNFFQLNLFFSGLEDSRFNVLVLSFIFIFIGLLLKMGVAPFHMWLPDVYQGSPLVVTAFFAIIPKIVFLSLLIKIIYKISGPKLILISSSLTYHTIFVAGLYTEILTYILFLVGFLSIIVGTIGALGQSNIKRFFAYSSISNVGFMIMPLSLNSLEGIQDSLFYLFIYVFLSVNFFAILMALKYISKLKIVNLSDLSTLNSPLLSSFFAFNLFSLAGIPPLAGFYSKFYVYYALISASFYVSAFVIALITIMSTFYYIRLISILFFNTNESFFSNLIFRNSVFFKNSNFSKTKMPLDLAFLVVFLTMFNCFIFLEIDTIISFFTKIVKTLF